MSLTDRHAFIVAGRELAPPPGLEVTNHLDPDVLPFAGQSRVGRKVDELIIHESVTRSAVSTVAVLQRRKLGVHLIVAPDGRVTQHGDLAHERLAHAGRRHTRRGGSRIGGADRERREAQVGCGGRAAPLLEGFCGEPHREQQGCAGERARAECHPQPHPLGSPQRGAHATPTRSILRVRHRRVRCDAEADGPNVLAVPMDPSAHRC